MSRLGGSPCYGFAAKQAAPLSVFISGAKLTRVAD